VGEDGQNTFRYECQIIASQLDENGFVIDNFMIDRCFHKWTQGRWYASCEALASGTLQVVHKAMNGRAQSIRCKIIPNDFANIEVSWVKGEELPEIRPTKENKHAKVTK
jgi:hypothetical protein